MSIATRAADGQVAIHARDIPLQGVSLASPRTDDVEVCAGGADDMFTHEVRRATALKLDLTRDGADRALIIDASDGTTTTVEFRSPMRPEEVDGIAWHG